MNSQNSKTQKASVLVYSCSGCSSAAQMANAVAVKMDREGVAVMSCIAGVGGGVKSLVNQAKKAQTLIGLDGCPLQCVKQCLSREGLAPTIHYDLSAMGVSKEYHQDFDPQKALEIYDILTCDLRERLKTRAPQETKKVAKAQP